MNLAKCVCHMAHLFDHTFNSRFRRIITYLCYGLREESDHARQNFKEILKRELRKCREVTV